MCFSSNNLVCISKYTCRTRIFYCLTVNAVHCRFSPFPEVAESVQQELESYRAQEDEVKRLKSIMVRSCVRPGQLQGDSKVFTSFSLRKVQGRLLPE